MPFVEVVFGEGGGVEGWVGVFGGAGEFLGFFEEATDGWGGGHGARSRSCSMIRIVELYGAFSWVPTAFMMCSCFWVGSWTDGDGNDGENNLEQALDKI